MALVLLISIGQILNFSSHVSYRHGRHRVHVPAAETAYVHTDEETACGHKAAEKACGRKAEERACGHKAAEKESGHRADVKADQAAVDREQAPSRKGAGDALGKASRAEAGGAEAANGDLEAVGIPPREAEALAEVQEVDSTW